MNKTYIIFTALISVTAMLLIPSSVFTPNITSLLSSLSEKGMTIFSTKDIIAELKCSYVYAKVIAHDLAKKKWIAILRRGTYLIMPLSAGVEPAYTEHEFVIASHLLSPYYIAYWSALNFHRLTEQTPFTVFIATTKRMMSRKVFDVNYSFITLKKRSFFGFVPVEVSSHKVNVSDLQKTLADALDHLEYCGGISEVAKCLWNARKKMSLEKVVEYSIKMGNMTILKRLGYLIETLRIVDETNGNNKKTISNMKRLISPGMSILDPTVYSQHHNNKEVGRYNTRWNLLVNISKETLENWKLEENVG